jgi:hypothetical protein
MSLKRKHLIPSPICLCYVESFESQNLDFWLLGEGSQLVSFTAMTERGRKLGECVSSLVVCPKGLFLNNWFLLMPSFLQLKKFPRVLEFLLPRVLFYFHTA